MVIRRFRRFRYPRGLGPPVRLLGAGEGTLLEVSEWGVRVRVEYMPMDRRVSLLMRVMDRWVLRGADVLSWHDGVVILRLSAPVAPHWIQAEADRYDLMANEVG